MNKTTKIIVIAVLALAVGNVAYAKSLTVGSTGSDVVSLQTFLIDNGYTIPLIESGVANKGYFGEQTSNAVKMYQEDNEIEPTGVIDSSSYAKKNILGAVVGPDTNFRTFFNAGYTAGGNLATSSTATTYRTDAKDFNRTPTVVQWTPNVNTTVSISGTSTFAYIPKVGDVANIYILNASTTAGSSITFAAADSGVDMQFAEATGGELVLNGLDWAKVTLIRKSLNQVTFIFDEMTEAD